MRAVAIVVLSLPCVHAFGGFVTFTDRSAWESATDVAVHVETFEGVAPQIAPNAGGTLDLPLFDVVVDENHGGIGVRNSTKVFGGRLFSADLHLPIDGGPNFIDFVFDAPVSAFGAYFADAGDLESTSVFFTANGERTPVFLTPSEPGEIQFFGFVSDQRFTTLRMTTDYGLVFFLMDDVTFAEAIPEPGTLALLGLGGLSLFGSRLRRRR